MSTKRLNNTVSNYLRICSSRVLATLGDMDKDLAALCAEVGLDGAVDVFPANAFSGDSYRRLVSHLEESGLLSGVGLIVGGSTQLGDLGLLGYASQTSRTFWEGLNVCVPFAGQLGWNFRIQHLRSVHGKSEMRLQPAGETVENVLLDQWLTVCLTGVERLMPPSLPVSYADLDFYFPYAAPRDLQLYRRFFKDARLHFSSDFCGWRYPSQWNAIELATRDDIVAAFCTRELTLQHTQRAPKTDITSRVRCFIYAHSEGGFPTMAATADHLNMSVATLRRKLKARDTHFEALVEDMRKEMAATLIAKPDITGEELAYQLGYRHSSNFYAAFKGWFGCSPKEYRRGQLQQAAG
ncbi:MAG: helix-turn-helix domain-containing protein [Spongiibacteraceae bacterium]